MNKNIDILTLTSGFIPNLGINRGRMGSVVYFCFLSRETNNIEYQKYARTLLEWIISDLNATIPINFADGLSGIGWGIDFLIRYHFLEYEALDILIDIDSYIMKYDPLRFTDDSFEYGTDGIVTYVMCRLLRNRNNATFDNTYINNLYQRCLLSKKKGKTSSLFIKYYEKQSKITFPYKRIFSHIVKASKTPPLWILCLNDLKKYK